ncbi:uncharacterized protein LOC128557391 [Mercenaria mercenaria]|uniref:uncharacterized protein LOC128557391 n=1 Tax=Mercenaria mercenaria TaxID=6596 RepID=UPI00234F95FE|nr:uncharacterized protein LOC128557391 [Mercenaria mercenaria]
MKLGQNVNLLIFSSYLGPLNKIKGKYMVKSQSGKETWTYPNNFKGEHVSESIGGLIFEGEIFSIFTGGVHFIVHNC